MKYDGVLVLLIDGARPDVMTKLASAGEMPVFKQHFVDAGGFRQSTSVFPTVSGPAHLPALTGLHPGTANIPGIRWAECPGTLGFLGHTRSYMSLFRPSKLARDLGPNVSTLFQHIPRLADINTWFVRGCGFFARRTRFSKALSFFRSFVTKDWFAGDRQAEAALRGALGARYKSAFAVFPSIDELGHRFGPMSEPCLDAYRRFDAALGRIIDDLVRARVYEQTLLTLTSDHGQSETHTHFELSAFAAERIPRTLAYPKFWRHSQNANCAVMVSGNSMANIYLRPHQGWKGRGAHGINDEAETLKGALLEQPSIDHVIHRAGPDTYVVEGAKGRCVIDARSDGATPFETRLTCTVHGENPLGFANMEPNLLPDEVWRATSGTQYPDAPWQIVQFFRSKRAGDLVVCAKNGFDLRDKYEYQPHLGSHGGLDKEHMLVPAAINARWDTDLVRSVDLFPTVLTALGHHVPSGVDGVARALSRA